MKIKEHDEGRSFKVPSDVERYLIRIIQRYFDVENTYSMESVEAIIVESLTRLKRDFMSKKGFVFNINQATGHLVLDISSFNGEPVFDKKTAFNKDFGNIVDTITEGNDPRLSDERDPLSHVHVIGHIKELEDQLNQSGLPQAAHSHRNQTILDMLEYAGTQTQIDLVLVELFADKIAKRMETLTSIRHGLIFSHNVDMKPLYDQLAYVQKHLIYVQKLATQVLAWVDAAKKYTDVSVQNVANYLEDLINRCMTPEEAQAIYDKFKQFVYLAEEGEIPLPDGQVSLHAETSEDISAGDGDAGTLRIIFEEGLQLGNTNWSWDNNTMSFVYNTNDSSYSVFLSPNTYQDYTHRVTLKSNNGDDDVISVILAYDDETQSHLSLICHVGGLVNKATNSSTPCISVVKDFYKNGSFSIQPVENLFHNFGVNKTGWNTLTNGISILVKRIGNVFKVWTLYNELHDWHVIHVGNRMEINPTQNPTFEFDLTKYPTLSPFVDKACKYGYGCMSQAKSTYSDVFYYAPLDIGGVGDKQGHTTITRSSNLTYHPMPNVLDESMPKGKGRVKLFFRYDNIITTQTTVGEEVQTETLTETITIPLPILILQDQQTVISIQGFTLTNGGFEVQAMLSNTIPDYVEDKNVYNNKEVILTSTAKARISTILNMFQGLERPYGLCCITDQAKFDFIKALLQSNHQYFFNAIYDDEDNQWVANEEAIDFFYWASGQPELYSTASAYLKYGSSWKMYSDSFYGGLSCGYVAEYPIKHLSDYFTNPRIYYQIYGIKE